MKKMMTLCLACIICLMPKPVYAHVKWFTEEDPNRVPIETIISPLFICLTCLSIITLICLLLLEQHLSSHHLLKRLHKLSVKETIIRFILQYSIAVSLFMQLINGNIFAPEIHIHNPVYTWLLVIVIFLYIIPHQLMVNVASFILLLLYLQFSLEYSWFHMLDYFFYIGLILYFLMDRTRLDQIKYPIMYVTLGISLCWLAAEKWVYPHMTMNIIELYHVPIFGLDPIIFTVIAAFVEFSIGIAWIFQLLNRFFAIVFTIVMFMTTLMFGYMELIGHFLLHIMMIVFIINGKNLVCLPSRVFSNRQGQVIFLASQFILLLTSIVSLYYYFG
ncbi:MAG TPA: hypothetical protein VK075_01495 [Pseudogracilibacillus sp.]|nr:hypothetical protein [Pseudogracilibacillus sp.]